MQGQTDLKTLLRSMSPQLHAAAYGFAVLPPGQDFPTAFARIAEDEGMTVIAPVPDLQAAGIQTDTRWARISLTVHSDLSAVGLTAAFATALAQKRISANVVAGYCHDHIFVQWESRDAAMSALKACSDV